MSLSSIVSVFFFFGWRPRLDPIFCVSPPIDPQNEQCIRSCCPNCYPSVLMHGTQAAPAAKATKVDDDDDVDDDLFGDDEEEEAAKPAEKSRAEKMAEAKAAKDAKKKIDR